MISGKKPKKDPSQPPPTNNEIKIEKMRELVDQMSLQFLKSKENLKKIKKIIKYKPFNLFPYKIDQNASATQKKLKLDET